MQKLTKTKVWAISMVREIQPWQLGIEFAFQRSAAVYICIAVQNYKTKR